MIQTSYSIKDLENLSGIIDVRVTLSGLDRTAPRVTFREELDLEGEFPAPVATIVAPRKDAKGDGNTGVWTSDIEFELSAPGADFIELKHWGEVVAKVSGDKGKVKVATRKLGGGPLRFRPLAKFGDTGVLGREVVDRPQG